MKSLITNEKYSLVNDTIATVAMSVLVILGAERVYSHGLTVGDLLIFLTYLSYLYNPLQTISDSIADTRSYFAASKRVFEIYNYNQPIPEVANPRLLKNIHGKITFHDVSASYGRHGVLHNIDLTIEPGEKVGVIGRSGEGKTTLFNLLPRFYEYQKGTISIDDIPIDQVSLTNLRDQFAIVSQDAPLLNTSIADNLKIAQNSTSISHQDIEQALRDANAYEFIHQLPKGLKTNVGEHSRLLSGGQRQRIAIARAFLKNAPIVLLDEPSTGLDEESVSVILEALQRLMAQRTTLIISHSLEILKNTDTIYLLDKGHIAAKTTYQSLISDYTYSRESTPNELAIFRESMFDQVRSKPLQ
jgi:ATP-binding cassette subfamily B protein